MGAKPGLTVLVVSLAASHLDFGADELGKFSDLLIELRFGLTSFTLDSVLGSLEFWPVAVAIDKCASVAKNVGQEDRAATCCVEGHNLDPATDLFAERGGKRRRAVKLFLRKGDQQVDIAVGTVVTPSCRPKQHRQSHVMAGAQAREECSQERPVSLDVEAFGERHLNSPLSRPACANQPALDGPAQGPLADCEFPGEGMEHSHVSNSIGTSVR